MLTRPQRIRLHRLRWTAFVLVALAYILSFFHRVAPAAIADELQQTFQASGAALGSLAATYFYVYTLMQVPTGVLVDTLGVRRIVTLGGVIAGIGSVLFGLAETLLAASIGRLLVGLGVSFMFLSLLKINALWFRERHFGTITGFTMLLGNAGAVLAAAPLVWVLGFTSWRTVFVVLGIFRGCWRCSRGLSCATSRAMPACRPCASSKGWRRTRRASVTGGTAWSKS